MKNNDESNAYGLNLIINHLTGNLPDSPDGEFERWLAGSEENRIYYSEIKKLWDAMETADANPRYDSLRASQLFKSRIYGGTTPARNFPVKKTAGVRRILYAAAIVIPFLFLSYFTSLYFITQPPDDVEESGLTEVVVPNGSKTQLKLQDGTSIWLNSGSKIRYTTDFGKKKREINLSGEAYLDVAHNKDKPLVVTVGDLKVNVLGTRFNVNAYQENKEVNIALLEGSVELTTRNDLPVLLSPKEVARYDPVSRQTTIARDSSDYSFNWLANKLVFEGETFEQIIRTLERRFDVEVTIRKEAIKSRHFVGDFVNNETIEQIFNVMSADGKFRYKMKGNRIDVY